MNCNRWNGQALVGRADGYASLPPCCMTSLFILFFVLHGFGDDKGHAAQPSSSKAKLKKNHNNVPHALAISPSISSISHTSNACLSLKVFSSITYFVAPYGSTNSISRGVAVDAGSAHTLTYPKYISAFPVQ